MVQHRFVCKSNPSVEWRTQRWLGNAGKDAVVGPGLVNFNWSLFKTITIYRGRVPSLELRFEYFNVFNHTGFNNIDQNSGDGNFGQVTTAYDPRTLQLGAKFQF